MNCEVNKTEVVCFSSKNYEEVPRSFLLGQNTIQLVDSSKALGIIIDRKLNFKDHGISVYNNLIYKWVTICRSCNRNWGLNHLVLSRISKTVLFSLVFYGCSVWMNDINMKPIDRLWCKIAKTAVGAIFNVNQSILEVILGIPPLDIQRRVINVKHYLKALSLDRNTDQYLDFIISEYSKQNPFVVNMIKEVGKFFLWKLEHDPDSFSDADRLTIQNRQFDSLHLLTNLAYSKKMMTQYTENLWQIALNNRLMLMGERRAPTVSTRPIPLPLGTNRKTEVLMISLLYKQNLLNSFLYLSQRNRCPSPLCKCLKEEQTAYHIISSCELVDEGMRRRIDKLLNSFNGGSVEGVPADYISILNCIRNDEFVKICLEIVEIKNLELKSVYIIS